MKEKLLVSLDGSIESLVTTWLLKKQGFQLRAIIFDVSEGSENKENMQQRAIELERKLGIQVQLVECSKEAKEVVFKEIELGVARGYRTDMKTIFHQKFLFPMLFVFKEQYKFQKIATGHIVNLQYEPLENKMKVLRNPNSKQDVAHMLIGLTQEELQTLVFPLGSIPLTMMKKLASELELVAEIKPVKFELHYKVAVDPVVATIETPASKAQAVVVVENVIKEVWLEQASWFADHDLGFKMKSCLMSWKAEAQPVPVKLIQYEGGGIKALLDQAITGEAAKLFSGDSVVWIEGDTVLGGARVVKCL